MAGQQRSHVPAFGNWESEGNVPYTVFFDKARKGRGGGPIKNPNDPEEYPDMFTDNSQEAPPTNPTKPKDDTPVPALKPTTHERRQSREYANSPGHRENPGRRQSGSEYGINRSPLHRQAKPSGRESPAVENKGLDAGNGNRGNTRMKPLQRDDAPEGTAVPKFGSWDVNNPASADGFTHIFGKVREERMGPGTPPPQPHSSSPYNNVKNRKTNDSAKVSCFPCLRGK